MKYLLIAILILGICVVQNCRQKVKRQKAERKGEFGMIGHKEEGTGTVFITIGKHKTYRK